MLPIKEQLWGVHHLPDSARCAALAWGTVSSRLPPGRPRKIAWGSRGLEGGEPQRTLIPTVCLELMRCAPRSSTFYGWG